MVFCLELERENIFMSEKRKERLRCEGRSFTVDCGKSPRYKWLKARTFLGRTVGVRMRFDYTLNVLQLHKVRLCSTHTRNNTALSQTLTDGATKWELIYLHSAPL